MAPPYLFAPQRLNELSVTVSSALPARYLRGERAEGGAGRRSVVSDDNSDGGVQNMRSLPPPPPPPSYGTSSSSQSATAPPLTADVSSNVVPSMVIFTLRSTPLLTPT